MIYIEKTDIYSTIGTYLYCHLHMLYNAEKKGLKAYINWRKERSLIDLRDNNRFEITPNMYDWYFKQPNYYDYCFRSDIRKPKCDEIWTWEHKDWGANVNTTDYQLISEPLHIIKDYYKKNLIFNDYVNARGQQLVDKYNIDFSKTIGISWRGTDIYLESQNGNKGRHYIPIERYFKWIDKALEEIPNARIACTSEEAGRLEPLFNRYPQAFLIDDFLQAPFGAKDNPEKLKSNLSGFEKGMNPVLMMWLFSKCAWYIKTRSSMAAVASWISDGKIVSIAHPENLGYVDANEWLNKDEFEGKIYEI